MNVSKRILVVSSAIAGVLAAAGTLYSGTHHEPGAEEISTGHDAVVVRAASAAPSFAGVTGGAGVVEGRNLVVRPNSGGYSSTALTDEDSAANAYDQITAQPTDSAYREWLEREAAMARY